MSTRWVADKRQVPEFDPRAWSDENPEEPEVPSDPCPVCNSADNEDVLLLCDGCDASYHTYCIGLDSVPVGPWFCMECMHAFGPEIAEHADVPGGRIGTIGYRSYYSRTQGTVRRARQRARHDEWQGAWGRITGRVWDALELDLDYDDEEDSDVYEGLRRSQQLRERERQEQERWQQRLNIASRLGAREVFARSMPALVAPRPQSPPEQSREEQLAWGALEKAREMESRKRKSRTSTPEPHEEPHQEPERKLKRPRTRRLPPHTGESADAGRDAGSSSRQSASSSSPSAAPPSFLASLLREVEMSTPSDRESIASMYGHVPGVNDGPSPAGSPSHYSHGSITPPPVRSGSPQMTLSSHIAPIYPPANYSPTRIASSSNSTGHSRSSSPHGAALRDGRSSSDNSDTESRGRRQPQRGHHGALELRQPQPRRMPAAALQRSQDVSPSRSALPLEMKQSICKIVRSALKPHWRSSQLTAEQYEMINRDISRKIYEEVKDPTAVDDDTKQGWEQIATREVARAVASLKA